MYYRIDQGRIIKSEEQNFLSNNEVIAVYTKEEWKNQQLLKNIYQLNQSIETIHFCNVERHMGYLFGACYVPIPKEQMKHKEFIFYIVEGKIIFIDDSKTITTRIQEVMMERVRKSYTIERLLYDILSNLIDNDLFFLELLEQEIAKIEELLLRGILVNFNTKMLEIKKMISKLYRYYSQIADLSEELLNAGGDFFDEEGRTTFQMLSDRAIRLKNETQTLREYAMQVQDVYQSEIGIRQNNVMKVLTIVTTIFLPLTLIVGWYGMNFCYMPELKWKYGYPVVIGISVAIVIGSLLLFKRKKYW